MNKEELKQLLPHREPMLLLDEAERVDGQAIGKYTVRGDEFFLQGHFPGNPVVPGVILCEMMGQSSCVLLDGMAEGNATPYFTGLNNIKFKNKVLPGDTIVLKSELLRSKGPFYFIKAAGYVNEKLCVSGELSFAVIKG
ncbi:3-hydroxyacyl-[acyl-carrier-protein] dehydratase FabZ [Clostridia bacterium]|nr:3-hydroxyacyl-[acyl-carrier-protein] dehydratase FabZ [Clostridia bacterium]